MASRTNSESESKPAKAEAAQHDALADLCSQYRVIGIAAVAAAACAGKSGVRTG